MSVQLIGGGGIPKELAELLGRIGAVEEPEGYRTEHLHRCPKCQTTWSHVSANIKDFEKAHCCPKRDCEGYNSGFDNTEDASIAEFKNWDGGDESFVLSDKRRKKIQEQRKQEEGLRAWGDDLDNFLQVYVSLVSAIPDEDKVREHAKRFAELTDEMVKASVFSRIQEHQVKPLPDFLKEVVDEMLEKRRESFFDSVFTKVLNEAGVLKKKLRRQLKGRRGNGTASGQ